MWFVVPLSLSLFCLLLVVSVCSWLFWFVVGCLRCFQYVKVLKGFQVVFKLLQCVVV